jgi:hypothetical protein
MTVKQGLMPHQFDNAALNEQEKIKTALAYVLAHDRELWLRIGMAIKSELGEDGFDLWKH